VIGTPYGCERESLLFFNWELQLLFPAMANHLNNTVILPDGSAKSIAIPGSKLDFTVAPLVEVGFRLPDHLGQFSFSYRFIVTEGTETQNINGMDATVRSRLDLNDFNFDYATAPFEFEPHWFIQGRIGARMNSIFYE